MKCLRPLQSACGSPYARLSAHLCAIVLCVAVLCAASAAGALAERPAAGSTDAGEREGLAREMQELRNLVRAALGAPRIWPKLELPRAPAADAATGTSGTSGTTARPRIESGRLVSYMLADTEDVWDELFASLKRTYPKPRLILYTRNTWSGCGVTNHQVSGPLYCENDKRVYLDLAFFDELRASQSVSGDMAMYYVIGHEIGHHVQQILGILPAVGRLERRLAVNGDTPARNALSVRVELQADCMAGLVAYHAHRLKQRLETDDVEIGLQTAAALGADRLQRLEHGVVQPESFTHGASEQRIRWFRRGLDSGALHMCDTFSAEEP